MRDNVLVLVDELKASGLSTDVLALVEALRRFVRPIIVAQCYLPKWHWVRRRVPESQLQAFQPESWDFETRELAADLKTRFAPSWVLAIGWSDPGLVVELKDLDVPTLLYINDATNSAAAKIEMAGATKHALEICVNSNANSQDDVDRFDRPEGFRYQFVNGPAKSAARTISWPIFGHRKRSSAAFILAEILVAIGRPMSTKLAAQVRLQKGPNASAIPARWQREPSLSKRRLCVFVMLARGGFLQKHSIDHARAWHDYGFDVVTVIVSETSHQEIDISDIEFAAGVLQRENRGYDFGAWSAALQKMSEAIIDLDLLVIANDSVLGPSAAFGKFVDRIEASQADLIGPIESVQRVSHFQSFVLAFKQRALRSEAFKDFWSNVGSGDKDFVIKYYETRLKAIFERSGLRSEAIFSTTASSEQNPSLASWKELIVDGFPYLKIELLRLNTCMTDLQNWRSEAKDSHFNLERLDEQIRELRSLETKVWAMPN